jgi:hypothetical protein
VLPYDQKVRSPLGRPCGAGGAPRSTTAGQDMWIAACCLTASLPLLTLSRIDFRDFADHEGLVLLS